MSIYVYGTRLSYRDYLQAKSFEDGLRFEIDKQTRSIIASNEELQQEGLAIVKQLGDSVARGFEQLSIDIDSISSGIDELNSTFRWGFSEIIASLGHINDALNKLILIAKTPSQTWAYEQFDIARNAFRQGLYEDTLEYLNCAINGFGGNTGYKIEYRFHFLLGTVRIGSFKNNSSEIVNLVKAESAFLAAAKYARHDLPHEAGRALVAAGWAAYCQGKFTEAQEHTKQAISLYPDLPEAHFQSAKIQMHVGSPDRALPFLRQAIELDRGYSIKAAADNDFKRYEAKVHALLNTLRQEAKEKAEKTLVATQQQAEATEKQHVQNFTLTKYAELAPAKHALNEASDAAQHHTYFGYLDALSFCTQARQNLQKALADFVTGATAEVRQRIADLDSRISRGKHSEAISITLLFVGVIISFILAYIGSQGSMLGFVVVWLVGLFLSVCILFIARAIHKRIFIATLKGEKDQFQRVASEIQMRLNKSESELKQASKDTFTINHGVTVGKVYEGEVSRIMDFGAYVTILPGREEGLVHISQICKERVERVSDKLSEGDKVKVKVLEVNNQGHYRLSMKAVEFTD